MVPGLVQLSLVGRMTSKGPKHKNIKKPLCHYLCIWQVQDSPTIISNARSAVSLWAKKESDWVTQMTEANTLL